MTPGRWKSQELVLMNSLGPSVIPALLLPAMALVSSRRRSMGGLKPSWNKQMKELSLNGDSRKIDQRQEKIDRR